MTSLLRIGWPAVLMALLIFGFASGAVLRVIVLAFERDDPRRRELLGELYHVPRVERPFWVAEKLELALGEGLGGRLRKATRHWGPRRNMDIAGRVLALAQQTADVAIADARREAEFTVSQAQREAEEILREARRQAQQILAKAQRQA
jgi:DivIVA protein